MQQIFEKELIKKHCKEILTWREFVLVSRSNGKTNNEIRARLQNAYVAPELIDLLMTPGFIEQANSYIRGHNLWMKILGIIKVVLGVPLTAYFLLHGAISLTGVLLILFGIVWLSAYSALKIEKANEL